MVAGWVCHAVHTVLLIFTVHLADQQLTLRLLPDQQPKLSHP